MMDNVNETKKKNYTWVYVLVFLAFIYLVGLGLFAFTKTRNDPKKFYTAILDKAKENLNKESKKFDALAVEMGLDLETQSKDETLALLNDVDVNFKLGLDYQNKRMYGVLDSKYQNSNLVTGDFYAESSKLYLKVNELFTKYYYTPVDNYDEVFDITNIRDDNIDTIYNKIIEALKSNLKDEYFTKEKEGKTTKLIFKLANENLESYVTAVVNTLKDDEKFMSACKELMDMTTSEVEETLEDIIYEFMGTESSIAIVSYVSSNDVVKVVSTVKNDYDEEMKLELNNINDEGFSFILTYATDEKLEGNISYKEKNNKLSIGISLEIEDVKVNLNLGMAYNLDGFTKPNIANASLFDDMTQDEALDLYEKMSTNETLLNFIEAIEKLGSSSSIDDNFISF